MALEVHTSHKEKKKETNFYVKIVSQVQNQIYFCIKLIQFSFLRHFLEVCLNRTGTENNHKT